MNNLESTTRQLADEISNQTIAAIEFVLVNLIKSGEVSLENLLYAVRRIALRAYVPSDAKTELSDALMEFAYKLQCDRAPD